MCSAPERSSRSGMFCGRNTQGDNWFLGSRSNHSGCLEGHSLVLVCTACSIYPVLSSQTESLWALKSQTQLAFSCGKEKWVVSRFYTELLPSDTSRATLFCFFVAEPLEIDVQPCAVDCKFTPVSLSRVQVRCPSCTHVAEWESFSLWQALLGRQTSRMTLLTFCNHILSLPVQHLPSTLSTTLGTWIWSKIAFSARQGNNDCADGSTPSRPHREAPNAVWPRRIQIEKCCGSCTCTSFPLSLRYHFVSLCAERTLGMCISFHTYHPSVWKHLNRHTRREYFSTKQSFFLSVIPETSVQHWNTGNLNFTTVQ